MRLRSIIAGVVLLVLTTSGAGAHEPESAIPTREVLVAADFIPAGEVLLPRDLTLREVAIDESNAWALTDPAHAVGMVAAIPIMVAQPITAFMLSPLPDAPPPVPALDALSDSEHYGVLWGHSMELFPRFVNLLEQGAAVPTVAELEEDLEGWLAAVEPWAAYIVIPAVVEFLEDELAWLEAHPPRPCYADAHEALRGWAERTAALFRTLKSAVQAQDPDVLMHVRPDLEAFMTAEPLEFMSHQTCWSAE